MTSALNDEEAQSWVTALASARGRPLGVVHRATQVSVEGVDGFLVLDSLLFYEITFVPIDPGNEMLRLHGPWFGSRGEFDREFDRLMRLFQDLAEDVPPTTYSVKVTEQTSGHRCGDVLVIINGFTTEGQLADDWVSAVRHAGWRGEIVTVDWRRGQLAVEWFAVKELIPGDAIVASHILRGRNYRSIRLLGHSLGADIAVRIAGSLSRHNCPVVGLALFGAALPEISVRREVSHGAWLAGAYNVYNSKDQVLTRVFGVVEGVAVSSDTKIDPPAPAKLTHPAARVS